MCRVELLSLELLLKVNQTEGLVNRWLHAIRFVATRFFANSPRYTVRVEKRKKKDTIRAVRGIFRNATFNLYFTFTFGDENSIIRFSLERLTSCHDHPSLPIAAQSS